LDRASFKVEASRQGLGRLGPALCRVRILKEVIGTVKVAPCSAHLDLRGMAASQLVIVREGFWLGGQGVVPPIICTGIFYFVEICLSLMRCSGVPAFNKQPQLKIPRMFLLKGL
jgi:hypothetical protein